MLTVGPRIVVKVPLVWRLTQSRHALQASSQRSVSFDSLVQQMQTFVTVMLEKELFKNTCVYYASTRIPVLMALPPKCTVGDNHCFAVSCLKQLLRSSLTIHSSFLFRTKACITLVGPFSSILGSFLIPWLSKAKKHYALAGPWQILQRHLQMFYICTHTPKIKAPLFLQIHWAWPHPPHPAPAPAPQAMGAEETAAEAEALERHCSIEFTREALPLLLWLDLVF